MKPTVLLVLCVAALALALVSTVGRDDPSPVARFQPIGPRADFRGAWHVVRPGESLQGIASAYYGNHDAWRLIAKANDVGMFPATGTELRIPALRLADR